MGSVKEKFRRLVRLETEAGPEWNDGRSTATPVAKTVTVGGFSRSWPSAVLVSSDGRTSRAPIIDLTRWVQVAIVLAALLALYEVRTRTRVRKERS